MNIGSRTFNFLHRARVGTTSSKMLSTSQYSVKEVQIPSANGYISGKLWEGSECEGRNNPLPFICTHGWLDNAGSFDTLIPELLTPDMKMWVPDAPGHGLSSHLASSHYNLGFEGILTIMRSIQFFGWDKVNLLGHSLGAISSFLFTTSFPDIVNSLVTLDNLHPGAGDPTGAMKASTIQILEAEKKLRSGKPQPTYTYEEILEKVIKSRRNTVTREGCEILLKRGAAPVPEQDNLWRFTHDMKVNIFAGNGMFTDKGVQEMASLITCPICTVIKEQPNYDHRQDLFRLIEVIKENGTPIQFHKVKGTHHFHLNDPSIVSPIIQQFWAQHGIVNGLEKSATGTISPKL